MGPPTKPRQTPLARLARFWRVKPCCSDAVSHDTGWHGGLTVTTEHANNGTYLAGPRRDGCAMRPETQLLVQPIDRINPGIRRRCGDQKGKQMPPYGEKIIVLGATGKQGGAVVRHLLSGGFTKIHALVRADADLCQLRLDKRITLDIGDLDDGASLDAAMAGAYGVFSVMPLDRYGPEAEIRRGQSVADAASRVGVGHFIYSSSGGADRPEGVPHFRTKYVIEQYVRELGLPASVLRPALLMENFTTFERPRLDGGAAVFRAAVHPKTRRQMVAVEDIGMIAADFLGHPDESIGQTLEIAGDELTGPEVAETYTEITGQPALFEEQPIEEVRAFDADFAAMFDWVNKHSFGADIGKLQELYPRLSTFASWLREHTPGVMPQ